jgi:hypothetical protein
VTDKIDDAAKYVDYAMDYINAATAQLQHAVSTLRGMEGSITPPNHLMVPWVGQNVKDCNTDDFSNSDCGPASLAMWLAYLNRHATVDEVSLATGQPKGFTYTLPAHLITAAAKFDLKLVRAFNLTFPQIVTQIDNANPLIVLVHYASLPKRYDQNFKAGHWMIVTGYDAPDTVIYNDPLWQDVSGEGIRLSWQEFDKALSDCTLDGNTPRQGLIKA